MCSVRQPQVSRPTAVTTAGVVAHERRHAGAVDDMPKHARQRKPRQANLERSFKGTSVAGRRLAVFAATVALIVVAISADASAQSPDAPGQAASPPPRLTPLRYDEDYSYLRDAPNRTGAWWERFKHIALDPARNSHLSFGMELRFRTEMYWNFNWGEVARDSYEWYRALPYADLHLGSNVRLFGQLIGAWSTGGETPVSGVEDTGFELLQGFAEFKVPLDGGADIMLRGGRQILSYGSERLIGARWGPNVPRSFDAGLSSLLAPPWRVDAFYARPVHNRIGSFNDSFDQNKSLWSVYATRSLREISPVSGIDLYYIGYWNAEAEFEQGIGNELRHTLGSRLFGGKDGWDWNFEAAFQFGQFNAESISAWSVASDTGYTFLQMPFTPRIGLKANIISGDSSPDSPVLGTFNPMFPKGNYFGTIGLIGPYNLINVHPSLSLRLSEQWTLQGAAVLYWRESLGDGLYNAAGNLVRPASGSPARYIGTQADVALAWEPRRWLSLGATYSLFLPGPFIAETGPSQTVHFIALEALIRF